MPDLTIRPIESADHDAWRSLWTSYLDFYETTVSEEVYQVTFKRLCDSEITNQNGLLALLDGVPVGLVHYIFHPHNWKVEEVCYLQDLYADPTVRGTGIGRALIEAVYAKADQAGKPGVYWLTQDFNTTARQLYDRIANVTPFIVYRR
ncbi:GNAT family N-acetyltransferase [Alisedimentitalea sp. MJ-SS2]|uniref:GNAT family N-acetyltransferase n=1 Tax=Aliisedimentitalea sp. MJ-SS2 TaxID=3049795 RepID=UPI0029085B3F|nr:GNAT family N-acetyltransferase [Alisedimentitalea sp. MJ-SS2]MDU8928771.1 GNAT family N-acetyltransferase [Alisedimentitalea sp. MJ-SS2]